MRVNQLLTSITWAIACFCAFACSAQKIPTRFSNLYALSGTWAIKSGNDKLYESWKRINDSTLRGRSFNVNLLDTSILEDVDLVLRSKQILYIPVVAENNHQPVTFKLISNAKGKYVFENLQHDYPQRVIYELPVNNALHAWIEGNTPSGFKKKDFRYKKE